MSYSYNDYITALKAPIIRHCFKVELLFPDESVAENITNYLINSSSNTLSCQYQQGVRKTSVINLINTSKRWLPSGNSELWLRSKIKISAGIVMPDQSEFYSSDQCGGVFIVRNPLVSHDFSNETCAIQLSDKYCLMNGECGGELGTDYVVNNGTTLPVAIQAILTLVGDPISPIIAPEFQSIIVPYTLRNTGDQKASDVMEALAGIVSANIFYDNNGIFHFDNGGYNINGSYTFQDTSKASIWDFDINEQELFDNTMSWNFDLVFNQCIVLGTNMDNNSSNPVVSGTSTNDSPLSDINIYRTKVPRVKRISDTSINTTALAQTRSQWELKKLLMMAITGNVNCSYLPSMQVNEVVSTINDPYYNFSRQRFLVNSFSFSLSSDAKMALVMCNTNDLNFSLS